jgi:hypothetical protein
MIAMIEDIGRTTAAQLQCDRCHKVTWHRFIGKQASKLPDGTLVSWLIKYGCEACASERTWGNERA